MARDPGLTVQDVRHIKVLVGCVFDHGDVIRLPSGRLVTAERLHELAQIALNPFWHPVDDG